MARLWQAFAAMLLSTDEIRPSQMEKALSQSPLSVCFTASFNESPFPLYRFLDALNLKHILPVLPEELSGIFDQEEYEKSQLYKRDNTRFSFYETLSDAGSAWFRNPLKIAICWPEINAEAQNNSLRP